MSHDWSRVPAELGRLLPASLQNPLRLAASRDAWNAARRGVLIGVLARLFYTVLGVVTLVGYEVLAFGWDFVRSFTGVWVATMAVAAPIGLFAALWLSRRTLKLYFTADEAEVEFLLDDELRREVLNFPVKLALVDFTLWVAVGSVLSFYTVAQHPDQHTRVLIHGLMSSVYAGQLVGMMEFYAMERFLGAGLTPFVMQGRRVSAIAGVWSVPVWLRILMLVLTTSIFPMQFLYLLQVIGDDSRQLILFMIGLTVANAIWQGMHVATSVSGTIGRLAGVFDRFQRNPGEADTHARVYRADALGRFAEMFEELVTTMQERDFIRGTFGRYVSQQVVDQILSGRVELGGTLQTATVLFADIRGFTAMSERMQPNEVVDLLNDYLENMVQAITAHEGIPDKFIGDGILAVWGVPMACERHEEKAVRAALEMLRQVDELNARRGATGAEPLRIGIGIHAGELIAGNIGSKKKMEFTVIGDTVNTCSRIESANKELKSALAISQAVWQALSPDLQALFSRAPAQKLRGKDAAVELYVR